LPLRTVHAELKIVGNYAKGSDMPGDPVSSAWFDNVRIYPRPQTHYVAIRLVGLDGKRIFPRPGTGWPPKIIDPSGKMRSIADLQVELRTEGGSRLVASMRSKGLVFICCRSKTRRGMFILCRHRYAWYWMANRSGSRFQSAARDAKDSTRTMFMML